MYLLITTQLSRFPHLYLHLPFVVGDRVFLYDNFVFFFSSLTFAVPILRFTCVLAWPYSRIISIFLAYLSCNYRVFPVYPYLCLLGKRVSSVCFPHLFEISRSLACWRLSRVFCFERSNVKKVDEMLSKAWIQVDYLPSV